MNKIVWSIFCFASVAALLSSGSASSRNCHGDINNLAPTGKARGGVSASQADARYNNATITKYKTCIDRAADKHCIQASLIAAIISRESSGGATLDKNGYGDEENGYGLMQCDKKSGLSCTSCAWNSCCHIDMMTGFLVQLINDVKVKHGKKWNQDRVLQGGVAAYNFGVDDVQTWERLDIGTTNHDYSNDVVARAKWFRANGWN